MTVKLVIADVDLYHLLRAFFYLLVFAQDVPLLREAFWTPVHDMYMLMLLAFNVRQYAMIRYNSMGWLESVTEESNLADKPTLALEADTEVSEKS